MLFRAPRRRGGLARGRIKAHRDAWRNDIGPVIGPPPTATLRPGVRPVSSTALALALTAAFTHASWNLLAKRSAHCRHFNGYYSVGAVVLFSPLALEPVSHVAPARELSMMVDAWFGARVLGEGEFGRRIVGAALIVGGVAALAPG